MNESKNQFQVWKVLWYQKLPLVCDITEYFDYLVSDQKYATGWPKSKFEVCFGYNSENMHFWPYVGKAKMCLGGESLVWKNCKQTPENCKQTADKHILALPT